MPDTCLYSCRNACKGAPAFVAYVFRRGALPFNVVRDTLRALLACDEEWRRYPWTESSTQVAFTHSCRHVYGRVEVSTGVHCRWLMCYRTYRQTLHTRRSSTKTLVCASPHRCSCRVTGSRTQTAAVPSSARSWPRQPFLISCRTRLHPSHQASTARTSTQLWASRRMLTPRRSSTIACVHTYV